MRRVEARGTNTNGRERPARHVSPTRNTRTRGSAHRYPRTLPAPGYERYARRCCGQAPPVPTNLEVTVPNSPQGEVDPAHSPANDITWLATTLFDSTDPVFTAPARFSVGLRHDRARQISWTALPRRGTTRRLVPTSGRFAAEAFANVHDAMSPKRQAAGRATRTAVRPGLLRAVCDLEADADVVFNEAQVSVIAAAAQGLGQTISSCAITLGPERYNRKPVVQLMNHRAETVGFLKVGANAATSAMVATEAAVLDQLARPATPPLVLPQVLWQSEWQGRTVACFSPVSVGVGALVPADQQRLVEIAHRVVTAGGGSTAIAFRDCSLLEHLRTYRPTSFDLGLLIDQAEMRFGECHVSVGQWHGDFSPWNMISTATTTALLDWEFARKDMPIGADLLHHRVMVATHLHGDAVALPLKELVQSGNNVPELHAMGVPSEHHRPTVVLYLFELIRRDLELQQSHRPDTGFGAPAVEAVHAMLAAVR